MRFADIYITRLGAGITLPSACASTEQAAPLPNLRALSNFGQGLAYRFVLTPQVWGVTGDGLSLTFDSRTVDTSDPGAEVAHATTLGGERVRFSVSLPVAGGAGLEYARLAAVIAPVAGVERRYQCVIGISTLAADLTGAPSGGYARTAVLGTAQVAQSGTPASYVLTGSSAVLSADFAARRVSIILRLIGTPAGGGAPVDLGSFAASGPIDPATGNFNVPLSGSAAGLSGAVSGRFFGPAAVELGAAFGGTVPAGPGTPALVFSGGLFGAR